MHIECSEGLSIEKSKYPPPWIWLSLVALYLIIFGTVSHFAPCGVWVNRIYEVKLWSNSDPGGWYLPSAHELYSRSDGPLCPGHPGLPLQVALHAVQWGVHVLRPVEFSSSSFSAYCAHSIYKIWFCSDILIITIHLITFFIVYAFAYRLLLNGPGALLATLLYATSLPVLYYLTRVSPEPFLMGFQIGSFLSVWRVEDASKNESHKIAALWAAIAGALSIAAVFTKMHLAFALPVFVIAMLLLGTSGTYRAPIKRRVFLALISFLTGLITIPAWLSLMNLEDFVGSWKTAIGSHSSPFNEAFLNLPQAFTTLFGNFSPLTLIPALNLSNVFLFCEFALVSLAVAGFFILFRDRPPTFARFLWVSLFSVFPLGIWLYRAGIFTSIIRHYIPNASTDFHGFHYLLPVMPLLCSFAAYLCMNMFNRMKKDSFDFKNMLIIAGVIVAVHHTVFWCVFDSRKQDIGAFALFDRAVQRAMAATKPGERIALIATPLVSEEDLNLGGVNKRPWHWQPDKAESVLVKELQNLFVVIPSSLSKTEIISLVKAMNITAAIELVLNEKGRICSVKEWPNAINPSKWVRP